MVMGERSESEETKERGVIGTTGVVVHWVEMWERKERKREREKRERRRGMDCWRQERWRIWEWCCGVGRCSRITACASGVRGWVQWEGWEDAKERLHAQGLAQEQVQEQVQEQGWVRGKGS